MRLPLLVNLSPFNDARQQILQLWQARQFDTEKATKPDKRKLSGEATQSYILHALDTSCSCFFPCIIIIIFTFFHLL